MRLLDHSSCARRLLDRLKEEKYEGAPVAKSGTSLFTDIAVFMKGQVKRRLGRVHGVLQIVKTRTLCELGTVAPREMHICIRMKKYDAPASIKKCHGHMASRPSFPKKK